MKSGNLNDGRPAGGAPAPGQTPGYTQTGYGAPAPGGTYPAFGPAPAYGAQAGAYGPAAAAHPRKGKRRRPAEIAVIAVSLAILLVAVLLCGTQMAIYGNLSSLFDPVAWHWNPPEGSFSVIQVVGAIQNVSGDALGINEPSYHHYYTVQYIKQLAANPGNAGILLYMDTPGGTVLECDEVYLALMDYKEKTGRPVWAYMAGQCASAGYYITSAADRIIANRQTLTGSIGVYITLSDTSGLYEKLGIETVLVRSGKNKGVGTGGVEITPEQRAVYQGIVDELYETFVQIVADGRKMTLDEARALSDGRPFTGRQALENGLIDELGDWDTALAAFGEETGAFAYYPNFSRQTALGRLLGGIASILPRGEADTLLDFAQSLPSGVPFSYYPAE